jgi:hypothetical protein
MGTIAYFAYGSNMLTERLRDRTSSCRPLGLGRLLGKQLAFHKRSKDGSGKCNIAPAGPDIEAFGVVFELDDRELPALDSAEGRGYGYERITLDVFLNGTTLSCWTYEATVIEEGLAPYDWYKGLVLAGLLQHAMPAAYLEQVKQIPAIADPMPERKSAVEAVALLAGLSQQHPDWAGIIGDWRSQC